jgi:hypothetical protein
VRRPRRGLARFDIADIVRRHRASLEAKQRLSRAQKRVLTDIAQCRTAVLGGHVDQCEACGYEHPAYNSCRNRHCPKCQALAQEAWIDARRARMLDVRHFHVVFTLPAELRPLAAFAPRVVFATLLHAALGATLVLHTWTRKLEFHPHVHAIVTAGGLTAQGAWHPSRRDFLFSVTAMGRLLRGKLMAALGRAYDRGAFDDFHDFDDPQGFALLMARLPRVWNVYAKAPFKKGRHVLDYLGRYTHRVGIANSRLLAVSDCAVRFRTKGLGVETDTPVEFLRRLLRHVATSLAPSSGNRHRLARGAIGVIGSPSSQGAASPTALAAVPRWSPSSQPAAATHLRSRHDA